jgi:hypothetical protein
VSHRVGLGVDKNFSHARTRVTVPLLGTVVYYTDYCIPLTSPFPPPPHPGGGAKWKENKQITNKL